MKKIHLLIGVLLGFSGFSQVTNLTNSYQPPQIVADTEVRMLPGFRANSNDGNYTNGQFFRAIVGNPDTDGTQPNPVHLLSLGENYVYSRSYLAPVTESYDYAPQIQSITYFDGLGRPMQNIAIKASPSGKDLVTPIIYDGFGRQEKEYLPLPQSGTTNGAIYPQNPHPQNEPPVSNPVYSGLYPFETTFYTRKNLENSPLDRVLGLTQVGDAWQSNPVTYAYEANTGGEVLKITPVTGWIDGASKATSLKIEDYYPAAQLYRNKVTDEDGNVSYEFKNGQGQTLMVRKMEGSVPVDTYYVYNEFDQLAFVLSPLASKEFKMSPLQIRTNLEDDDILNELCYQYRYDGRNRLVEKKLPGKGWEYMVYDRADRLILTRDTKMEQDGKWLLTKYDKFGRVVYTGITPGSGRGVMQDVIKDLVITEDREDNGGFTKNGMDVFYTKHYYTDMESVLSVNYYDTYPAETPFPDGQIFGKEVLTSSYTQYASSLGSNQRSTKGLPVASYVKNIENDQWTKNYTFYDTKGRAISSYAVNHLGGFTQTETYLDFAGVPQKTVTRHSRLYTANPLQIVEEFKYDNQNRLLKHYHEVVGKSPKELLAENTYNDIGQLTHKKVGNNIQEMKYSYNIRGWMTGINLDANENPIADKLFNYRIKYNNPANESLAPERYNGNIAEIDWWNDGGAIKRYSYQYDQLNRLLNGIYQDPDRTIPLTYINSESIEYDLNGNITRLYRNAKHRTFYTAIQIDNLTYNYVNGNGKSNRLESISDATNNFSGYEGGGGTIGYDANGNMTEMPDKGISRIDYNFLNLPTEILQNDNILEYTYRADGTKLKKKFTLNNEEGTSIINTEYLDGFQYSTPNTEPIRRALEVEDDATVNIATAGEEEAFESLQERLVVAAPDNPQPNNVILSFFPTAEGYYDYENFRYIYQYKDHLGNVRISYVKDESTGGLSIMDTNEYYPFGMSFLKPNVRTVYDPMAIPYNYKYNGKELQETGMYDYGARFYMPDIGRWGVVDPASELGRRWSPYTYAFDNPVMFIDPDGMWPGPSWSSVKSFAKGFIKTTAAVVKGVSRDMALMSNPGLLVADKLGGSAARVMNAYKKGGVKAAANQAVDSYLEVTGIKSVVQVAKGVAKGDAESIGSATALVATALVTHKAAGVKAAPAAETTAAPTANVFGQVISEAQRVHPTVNTTTLEPGAYAGSSIPARSTSQSFTTAERAAINEIGSTEGCHTCGATESGRASGNFTPDHQPVSSLVPEGTGQALYPHCASCSSSQGGTTSGLLRKGYNTENINQ